ncbi:hypothetical protein Mapa_007884 [Marchantia paleacea]|nr:hypothetical protein Mapa_007884 [Marchantia paleacea]
MKERGIKTHRKAAHTESVRVALDEHALLGLLCLALGRVLAELRQRIGLGTDQQSLLGRLDVLGLPLPRLEHGVLQSSSVGERHVPRVGRLVHGVEIQRGLDLGLAS